MSCRDSTRPTGRSGVTSELVTLNLVRAVVTAAIAVGTLPPVLPRLSSSAAAVAFASGAQQPRPDLKGPAPKLRDGTPDLSGVWQGGGSIADITDNLAPGETIQLLPEARRILDARQSKDDPEANCLPTGVPRIAPYPWRIVQMPADRKPTHIFFLFEANIHSYRQIFMDGRKHPPDPNPTWYGDSIGRWDGDTLVVDTVGYNDKFWFDFRGHPHTERLHTVERYTRRNYGTLVNEVTIEDPGAYARPFKVTFTAVLKPGDELVEYICNENNQDVPHIQGPPAAPGERLKSCATVAAIVSLALPSPSSSFR